MDPYTGYGAAGGSIYDQAYNGFWAKSETAIKDNLSRRDLASRSRMLEITSPVASALIGRLNDGVIGSGLHYQPLPESEYFQHYGELTKVLKKRLLMASKTHVLDSRGIWTFQELQDAAFYNMILSGDVFLIRHRRKNNVSGWRLREEFCCQTPEFMKRSNYNSSVAVTKSGHYVVDGVELSKRTLSPIAYWFTDNPFEGEKKFYRIPAIGPDGLPIVLHAKLVRRADQYRGIPLLAPVIEAIWGSYAYTKAELQAAIIEACMVFAVTTEAYNKTLNPLEGVSQIALDQPIVPEKSDDFGLDPFGMRNSYLAGSVNAVNYISPGKSVHLAPGEDIKSIDTRRPNSGFGSFIDEIVMLCGAALGIPKQILTQSFDSTYSSAKAATVQFNHTCDKFRRPFVEGIIKPLFEVFARETLDLLGVKSTAKTNSEAASLLAIESVWRSGEPPMVLDPTKELDYYLRALEAGLISRNEVAQRLFGHDAVEQSTAADREKTKDEV